MRTLTVAVVTMLLVSSASQAGTVGSPESHADAAREFVRTQIGPEFLEEMYQQGAQAATLNFENQILPALKRPLSENEKQRLFLFWHGRIKDLFPYSALEDMMVPVVTKHLTVEEIAEIVRFNNTPVGKKLTAILPAFTREAQSAGEQLGVKMADQKWLASTVEALKAQFPQFFPAPEETP